MERTRPRFFISSEQIKNNRLTITGPDVRHITRALRLGQEDVIMLLDGQGNQYEARIELVDKEVVHCLILDEGKNIFSYRQRASAPSIQLTLVQGLPKGGKTDFIIQKATELGVTRLIPLICQRSIVRLNNEQEDKKLKRWQRIAMEAAKQCRRVEIPVVERVFSWKDLLTSLLPDSLALMPWEDEKSTSLKSILRDRKCPEQVYVIIGPEGGFEPTEVAYAKEYGVKTVSLGPRILRTETAALAVVAIVLYELE